MILRDECDENRFMLRIFIPVTALGLAGLIGVQHVGERACLPHDLCQIEKATLPDEPAQRDRPILSETQ